jgi:hypothetical protein
LAKPSSLEFTCNKDGLARDEAGLRIALLEQQVAALTERLTLLESTQGVGVGLLIVKNRYGLQDPSKGKREREGDRYARKPRRAVP